jgi:hypothetical protein
MAVAGSFDGKCTFYRLEVEGSGSEVTGATLGHLAQLDLAEHKNRNRARGRGRAKNGAKITGISFRPGLSVAADTANGFNVDECLVTSNDDRIRLFSIRWPQQAQAPSANANALALAAAAVQITRSLKFSGHKNGKSTGLQERRDCMFSEDLFTDMDTLQVCRN